MTTSGPDWSDLNAYADGELSEREAIVLRARLAREPELAEALARINGLRNGLAGLNKARNTRGHLPTVQAKTKSILAMTGLAASLAAFCLFAWTEWASEPSSPLAIHRSLAVIDYALPTDEAQPAAVWQDGAIDLGASGLELVETRDIAAGSGTAYHYRGRNGCSLTLISGLPPADGSNGLLHGWATDIQTYTLVAQGMDRARFAAIARYAEALTAQRDRIDETRMALVEKTAEAVPCA